MLTASAITANSAYNFRIRLAKVGLNIHPPHLLPPPSRLFLPVNTKHFSNAALLLALLVCREGQLVQKDSTSRRPEGEVVFYSPFFGRSVEYREVEKNYLTMVCSILFYGCETWPGRGTNE